MGNKKRTVLLLGIPALVVVLLLVTALVRSPVLVRIPDIHSVRGRPLFILYNPFRDKSPEVAAERFLEGLRDGRCTVLANSFSRERAIDICTKQEQYPLLVWKLIDMKTDDGRYQFIFIHQSQNAVGDEDMSVWVKQVDHTWRVDSFTIGY
jgi:hypothetical protein